MIIHNKQITLRQLPKKALYVFWQKTGAKLKSHWYNQKAYSILNIWHKEKRHDHEKIKCCFLVQMPELWHKQSAVYQKMCEDTRFDTWMLIVPQFQIDKDRLCEYGDEREYFEAQCINGKYLLAKQNDTWIDIESKKFDYIFYQRPYDRYLPDLLKSASIVGKSAICYIPYATPEIKNTVIYPQSFFRNIYFGFMEDAYAASHNSGRFRKTSSTGLQHFLNIGYPPYEKCLHLSHNCRYRRILWTPRWSYDPVVGGSHFVEYNQLLTEYHWGESTLCVRPHPMMWQEFLRTGKLTQEQIEKVKSEWELHGILTDKNENIEDTFQETDILLSDNSSVIPMFFLTEKPIIYCEFAIDFGFLFYSLMPGLYIAKNWNDVEKYLKMLMSHEDPLLSVRQKIIKEHFSQHHCAVEQIVETVASDYFQTEGKK